MLAAGVVNGTAQTSGQKSSSPESSIIDKLQTPQRTEAGIALSATVDPEKYYVGPSDVLSVNLWISPPVQYRLEVTPEGTLIVPTVGEIPVSGMLLSRAKEKVLAAVRQTVSLDQRLRHPRPAPFGHRLGPRDSPARRGLHDVCDRQGGPGDPRRPTSPPIPTKYEKAAEVIQQMSLRRVIIRHRDGSESQVDLVKFLATKEDDLNPYLREGDVILVPRKDITKNVIGVYGEVNLPGRYEHVPGDRLTDALKIGQGLTRAANADSAEFSRLSDDGRSLQRNTVNLTTLVAGSAEDVTLAPGDRLVVRSRNEQRADYRVRIEGEVLFPGIYPITRDRTKISEVIREAGGFTEFAALSSAELNRRSVQPNEVELDRLMSLRGGVSQEDSLDYIHETELRLKKEIVNVDFASLFTGGDSTQDVYLQDEDVIRIPSVKRTIYVFGQIVSPGHIPYVPGEGPAYYVKKAGGFTDRARPDDLKIIKSKTKQWLAADETEMEEGDYIWVPKEPDYTFSYYMTTASQAATVLSVIIGMAAVIISLSN